MYYTYKYKHLQHNIPSHCFEMTVVFGHILFLFPYFLKTSALVGYDQQTNQLIDRPINGWTCGVTLRIKQVTFFTGRQKYILIIQDTSSALKKAS